MENTMKLGVRVAGGGLVREWDESGNSEIVRILIAYDESIIKSIQFVYAEKTGVRHSKVYGVPGDVFNFKAVMFHYPSEYLISVSGKYAKDNFCSRKLCSITFGSNKRKYGPFGTPPANVQSYDFNYDFGGLGGAFGGFHGSVSHFCITSIGIYIKPDRTLNTNNSMNEKKQGEREIIIPYVSKLY